MRRRAQRKHSSVIITNAVAVDLASSSAIAEDTEAAVGHRSDSWPQSSPGPAAAATASSADDDASCLTSNAPTSLSQQESRLVGRERLGRLVDQSSVGVPQGAELEAEHKAVKARLRAFEVAFAQENGGRKPRKPSEWGHAWADYERYAVLHAKRAMERDADVVQAAGVTAADLAWAAKQRRLASEAAMSAAEVVTRAATAEEASAADAAADEEAKAAEAAAQGDATAVASCSEVALSWLQTEEAVAAGSPPRKDE